MNSVIIEITPIYRVLDFNQTILIFLVYSKFFSWRKFVSGPSFLFFYFLDDEMKNVISGRFADFCLDILFTHSLALTHSFTHSRTPSRVGKCWLVSSSLCCAVRLVVLWHGGGKW
jgi:hypothetical protein